MVRQTTTFYEKSDFLRYDLEKRYRGKKADFPPGRNFVEIFRSVENFLNENVHKEVVLGAALSGDGLLTDHGAEHVAMVMQRASILMGESVKNLNGLEIFVLLLAIHFHDVGNILGRDEHEKKIFLVMNQMGESFPNDSPVRSVIAGIAASHGGKENGSRDTIGKLQTELPLLGVKIRPALLAGILRFADEIADDNTRAARFLGKLKKIPPRNQAFHLLSVSTQPPLVDGKTLFLNFTLSRQHCIEKCSKRNSPGRGGINRVFLYDEILQRLKKSFWELEYCLRFSRPILNLDTINATVEVFRENQPGPIFRQSFRLRQTGYPGDGAAKIEDLSPDQIMAPSGEALKKRLEEEDE